MKAVFIAEKPSVAQEFAKALKLNTSRKDGYLESDQYIVTWCVGHLVTMSYPEAYDPALKKWDFKTLPFLPKEFKYEIIEPVKKQFDIVSGLLNREDVDKIYVCTDSGREGEYIYRLVEQMAHVENKKRLRVWIDSQTEEEILRGIKEAKDLKEYDNLAASAYLRAKEDYLMGINFSRLLTLRYGYTVRSYLGKERNVVIAVGRVMTCVLGMIVKREREIREFEKTPFYRVVADIADGIEAEFRAVEGSRYYASPKLYKENGFKEKKDAEQLITELSQNTPIISKVEKIEKKKERKNPPLLYNLAELQNDCSKFFKISPDETLGIVQELYEKKLVTYPRTDARVLSTAVCKEIHKNLKGLTGYSLGAYANMILEKEGYKNLAKSRYVDDKKITDHYAIIPTGQGLGALRSMSPLGAKVYDVIVRRFLSIFFPAAEYQRVNIVAMVDGERFFAGCRVLLKEGYLKLSYRKKQEETQENSEEEENTMLSFVSGLKKGCELPFRKLLIKEGETSPPKRYNSGSIILAMENAGQLIEEEELREQIKGSGIGTSATRAEILKKLTNNKYIALNKKTQIITPTLMGEMIYDIVQNSIKSLLDPKLTASWEKGLSLVAEGTISEKEYMDKLEGFVTRRTEYVKRIDNRNAMIPYFDKAKRFYQKSGTEKNKRKENQNKK